MVCPGRTSAFPLREPVEGSSRCSSETVSDAGTHSQRLKRTPRFRPSDTVVGVRPAPGHSSRLRHNRHAVGSQLPRTPSCDDVVALRRSHPRSIPGRCRRSSRDSLRLVSSRLSQSRTLHSGQAASFPLRCPATSSWAASPFAPAVPESISVTPPERVASSLIPLCPRIRRSVVGGVRLSQGDMPDMEVGMCIEERFHQVKTVPSNAAADGGLGIGLMPPSR